MLLLVGRMVVGEAYASHQLADFAAATALHLPEYGGPARTRTEDQGIHSAPPFPEGVDYLFTHVGCGTL